MQEYAVYLSKCLLPVAPGSIKAKINNQNNTVTLINEGQINMLKAPGLTDIEFDCLLPQVKYPFAVYKSGFKDAWYYLEWFKSLKEREKPFQFIIARCMPDGKIAKSSNIKVSMESYTVEENAGKNGWDIAVNVRLKQYRDFGVKYVKLAGSEAQEESGRAGSTTNFGHIGIGSVVIVNGRLYGSSYGDAPGKMLTDYRGKINFINLKGSKPYHVTTMEGGWLGWVEKEQLTVDG